MCHRGSFRVGQISKPLTRLQNFRSAVLMLEFGLIWHRVASRWFDFTSMRQTRHPGTRCHFKPRWHLASPLSYRSTRFDDGLFRRHVAPLLLPWHQFFVFDEARLLAECHGAADTAQKHSKKTSGQLENGPSASEIKSWHDSGTFGKAQLQKGDGRFTWRQFSKRENSQIAFHRWSPNVPKCQWAPTNSTRCHLTACHSTSPAEREMNQRHVLFHHRRRGVSGPI